MKPSELPGGRRLCRLIHRAHRRAALGQAALPALLLRTFRWPQAGICAGWRESCPEAVRFGGLGRHYVLVVFADRPLGLLSHADGSGLFPEAPVRAAALLLF